MSETEVQTERDRGLCENPPQAVQNLSIGTNSAVENIQDEEKTGTAYFQGSKHEMEISHFRFPIDKNRSNMGFPFNSKALKREVEANEREFLQKFVVPPAFAPQCLLRPDFEDRKMSPSSSSIIKESDLEPIRGYEGPHFYLKDEDLVLSARIHHNHNKRKPHACQDCGRSFTQSKDLIRHIRTHSGEKPYECTQCRRAFARHDYLIKHFRIHSGEKPYECSHCGKKFAQRGSLVSHTRVHSELKPPVYKCNQCNKKFNQYDALARHATMHIINPSVEEQGILALKKCPKPQFK